LLSDYPQHGNDGKWCRMRQHTFLDQSCQFLIWYIRRSITTIVIKKFSRFAKRREYQSKDTSSIYIFRQPHAPGQSVTLFLILTRNGVLQTIFVLMHQISMVLIASLPPFTIPGTRTPVQNSSFNHSPIVYPSSKWGRYWYCPNGRWNA